MINTNKAGHYILPFLTSLLLTGCGDHNKTRHESKAGITGRYIDQTFLHQVPDSVAGTIPGYCYELHFISPDSVMINYGFEQGTLAYKKSGDHYVIVKAMQGRDMPFMLNTDHTITLMDSSWVKNDTAWVGDKPLKSRFKQVPDIKGKQWVIEQYLNERMIAGTYQLFKKDKPTGQKVVFTKEGKVSGLENYGTYSICYTGDCVGATDKVFNVIGLTTGENTGVSFAFKTDESKKSIVFYHIEPPHKDENGNGLKGGQAVLGKAFELRQY